jgi:cytochrome P450
MVAQTAVFLLAGYDTTANTLSYCLWLLSRHPDIQETVAPHIALAVAFVSC